MCSKKFFSKVTEPIDQWLESQGLYRKHTAHDPSCLFRAVAEQVFYSQCCHDIVRKQCVNFIDHNKEQFEKMLDIPFDSYLSKLSNSKEWGTQIELNALSLLYEREVIVFEQGEKPSCISINNIFTKSIMLCASSENHYDSVYPKSYIMKAAFCQSLAYEVLYKRVFGLVDVDFAVEKMLHKSSHSKREHYLQQNYLCSTRSVGLPVKTVSHIEPERFEDELNVRDLLSRGITPFPYKVAKALDPDIYRNIEFDVWSDLRREMKLGMLGGNDELQIGVKCLVKMQPDRLFHAHIQEMEPNNGPVIVFVEELGKKCTVSHDVLEPLPKNQKVQWSVPYKQQRHLATLSPKTPFIALSEFSSKWRKNKYNKSRKLKDMFMPTSLPPSTHCSPCNTVPSFHQDQPNNLHYPLEQFSYNSNTSLTSSEDCSNTSSQIMQSENINSRNLVPIPGDSVSSSTSPASLGEPDQIAVNSCNSPLQIIGVPVYHSVCSDSSGVRVSTPPSNGTPFPSYIICGSNGQGRIHQMPNNMDNLTFQPVNFYAQKSFHLNGSDLPFSDIPTLRFYYNLGHDYFRSGCLMWPSSNPTCSSHTSVPSSENSQILPDSTVHSEDDTCPGQKQPISPCHQQPIVQGIPHTASHPVPVTVQALPQGSHVPHMTSGIVSTVLPQVVPVSPTSSQPLNYPQSSHKLIQQPAVSPHTICPLIPQSPPIQPLFGMNNMWPGQQNSVIANPQRINSPENDSRNATNLSSEGNGNRGTDVKSPNTCQTSIAVHPTVVDSFTSPVYPYYVVEMDSVPYYNPCSYVMQTTSDIDVMASPQMHPVPSSPLPQIPSVMYHSQPLTTSGPVPHWISSDGVPQYTMAV